MGYDITKVVSSDYSSTYATVTRIQKIESISTIYAIFITTMSLYFVFYAELFSNHSVTSLIFHCSPPSPFFNRSSILNAIWGGTNLHLYGFDLGDYNTGNKLEM
ncbi:hypothetical protein MKW94_026986, partial [Papaver nudicaule]|nr:hypothetical protein [Papaver nudicaule]